MSDRLKTIDNIHQNKSSDFQLPSLVNLARKEATGSNNDFKNVNSFNKKDVLGSNSDVKNLQNFSRKEM